MIRGFAGLLESSRSEAEAAASPDAIMAKEDDKGEMKVPEEMFKDVKFFVVGDIDPKVRCRGGGRALPPLGSPAVPPDLPPPATANPLGTIK